MKFGQGYCQTTDLVGHRFGTLFGLGEDGASLRPVAQYVLHTVSSSVYMHDCMMRTMYCPMQ